MNENRTFCEIERGNGMTLLSDMEGYILEPSELLEIAQELVYTVNHYRDAIYEYNRFRFEKKQEKSLERLSRTKREACIYMMKCGDRYKIGVSIDVNRRLKDLDERPFKIELVASSQPIQNAYEVEKEIHATVENNRICGEWFRLNDEEAHHISEWIRTLGVEV